MRAQFVFGEVWIGLRRNLTMTIALVVVVAISLCLFGTGLLFFQQVNHTRAFWQGRVQLSVYLCTKASQTPQCLKNGPATPAEIAQIGQTLRSLRQVASVGFQSQAQAYAQFKQEFKTEPSFVRSVTPGQIPASFQVRLHNAQTDAAGVAATVNILPGVDQAVDDITVLNKFYLLLDGARNAVIVVAIMLIIAAVLLVANTIRLSAFNRRRETAIMRLVGASNFYVQLPFLVEAMLAGLFGWLLAAGLLIAVKSLFLDGLPRYFSFVVQLTSSDLVQVVIVAMVLSVALCAMTSFLTLRRYLRA